MHVTKRGKEKAKPKKAVKKYRGPKKPPIKPKPPRPARKK